VTGVIVHEAVGAVIFLCAVAVGIRVVSVDFSVVLLCAEVK